CGFAPWRGRSARRAPGYLFRPGRFARAADWAPSYSRRASLLFLLPNPGGMLTGIFAELREMLATAGVQCQTGARSPVQLAGSTGLPDADRRGGGLPA